MDQPTNQDAGTAYAFWRRGVKAPTVTETLSETTLETFARETFIAGWNTAVQLVPELAAVRAGRSMTAPTALTRAQIEGRACVRCGTEEGTLQLVGQWGDQTDAAVSCTDRERGECEQRRRRTDRQRGMDELADRRLREMRGTPPR